MMIKTKLYGICKLVKEISKNYFELKTTEDTFFYPSGTKFRIFINESEQDFTNFIQLTLF